ncbi:hypothetical protein LAZ67_1003537 [Cordylochernes scorpioides]|uniref:RNA-directed DNA polymerase n=1 Tax=Cordylochernes scorpioides TaxID=51811 RepID=A0ABY6JX01_9ARAC|nr:hypothetical protein LAZ67_1003537 [Cordylochernes scorpioides]
MDQRTYINFFVKNEFKCADAFLMLTVAYGEATLARSNSVPDARALQQQTKKIDEVEKMILANRRITVREVAEDLNISIGSCYSIFINDLGMRRVATKFVPKLLNCDQKQHRMNIANEMLVSVRDDPNMLQSVITGAWCIISSCHRVERSIWNITCKLCAIYAKQSARNARICERTKIGFCTTITPLLTHHLAPCDFFLFPKLKRPLKGRRYATLDEIKTASKEELKKILKNDFLKCFEDWENRWHKFIISHGDYFEGDKIVRESHITHPLPRLPSTFHIGFTTDPVEVDRMTEDGNLQRMTEAEDEYFADALTNMQPHCDELVSRLTDAIRGLAMPRAEEALIPPFDGSYAANNFIQQLERTSEGPQDDATLQARLRTLLKGEPLSLYNELNLASLPYSQAKQTLIDLYPGKSEVTFTKFLTFKLNNQIQLGEYYRQKIAMGLQLGLTNPIIVEALTEGFQANDQRLMRAIAPKTLTEWYTTMNRIKGTNSLPTSSEQFQGVTNTSAFHRNTGTPSRGRNYNHFSTDSTPRYPSSARKPPSPCKYCQGDHWNNECSMNRRPYRQQAYHNQPTAHYFPPEQNGAHNLPVPAPRSSRTPQDHARIRNPLNNLLKKGTSWHWDAKCQHSFDTLKECLTTKPVLHLFKEGLPCQLFCDASLQGIAGILKQQHPDGTLHPVQYYSRTLRPHEKNYTITELECLAVIDSVEKFRIYLAGVRFTIFTDHHALQWLKTIKNPTGIKIAPRLVSHNIIGKIWQRPTSQTGPKRHRAHYLPCNNFWMILHKVDRIKMEISPGASKTKGNDKPSGKKLTTNEATRHTLATVILELTAALQGARSTQLETVFRSATPGATDARAADFPFNCADSANGPDPAQQIFQASHPKPKTPQWRPFETEVGNPPNDTIKLTLDLYLTQDLPCTFLIEPDAAVNAYKEFIPDHARLRTPLVNLLKKDVMWVWDDECQKAFTNLKENLTTHPTLHLYQEGLPCQVYCNTSTFSITGVLKQVYPDGKTYTVQHFSRSLRSHERNYSDLELQCLAIVESVDNFRTCLMGRKFTIFSDHPALQWLKEIKAPSGRLFRWRLRLSRYEYEVRSINGVQQYETGVGTRIPFCGFLDAPLIQSQQSSPPGKSRVTMDHNKLRTVSRKGVLKTIVPSSLTTRLLKSVHTQHHHPNISKMTRLISSQYYWQNMTQDIAKQVKTCPTCRFARRIDEYNQPSRKNTDTGTKAKQNSYIKHSVHTTQTMPKLPQPRQRNDHTSQPKPITADISLIKPLTIKQENCKPVPVQSYHTTP